MTSAYILIAAILVLGGLLATLGDRLGTKVGKARLSLFNLRPRTTATVITIITGCLIAASTLGILFGLSESLRDGVFQLDDILRKLRQARREVEEVEEQKQQIEQQKEAVEEELADARAEKEEVQEQLDAINERFEQAQVMLKEISQQSATLRAEIESLLDERQELRQDREQLISQITQLDEQITQLQEQIGQLRSLVSERDQELAEQKDAIAQLDQTIVQRDRFIEQREDRLNQLEQQLAQRERLLAQRNQQLQERNKQLEEREKQLAFLQREVTLLEQYYQDYQALRQGNVALLRGQVLASGVVRIIDPSAANYAVDRLLREANRAAIEVTRHGGDSASERLVQISQSQVEQLIDQIKDGQDYLVRILSAGNYVAGEEPILVFADVARNQIVFREGEVLATVSTDPTTMTNTEVQQRLEQLVAAAQFRARRSGILGDIQIGDGSLPTIMRFIQQLDDYEEPLLIRAVAREAAYTAGPLKMQLVAIQGGQVVFTS